MKARLVGFSIAGALAVTAARSHAAVTVANPSFEADQVDPGTDNFGGSNTPPFQNITNWTVDRNDTAVLQPTSAQFAGPLNGTNVIFMNGAIVHQDLGTMVAGQTYSFDISYGWRSDLTPNLYAQQFAFILRPGITSPAAFSIAESPAFNEPEPPAGTASVAPLPVGPGVLQHDVISYTATASDNGSPLTIQLQTTDLQLLVDQVQLSTTTAVPEPASVATAGLAAAGLAAGRRRRRRIA